MIVKPQAVWGLKRVRRPNPPEGMYTLRCSLFWDDWMVPSVWAHHDAFYTLQAPHASPCVHFLHEMPPCILLSLMQKLSGKPKGTGLLHFKPLWDKALMFTGRGQIMACVLNGLKI